MHRKHLERLDIKQKNIFIKTKTRQNALTYCICEVGVRATYILPTNALFTTKKRKPQLHYKKVRYKALVYLSVDRIYIYIYIR